MAHAFDLIVFDWDGTLMDSTAHIAHAIQRACADMGVTVPSAQAARQVIGLSLNEALTIACPDVPADRYTELVDAYRKHFFLGDQDVTLFDGVTEGLEAIRARGIMTAVATGKSRRGLTRALDTSGLNDCFVATRTQDDCPSKPHPAMLLELMDELCVAPDRTLMVGDTTHDLLMAQQAGTHGAGVCSGAHPRSALEDCNPLGLFEDFMEFRSWLLPLIGSIDTTS
jgi:phosphoglycolate phosphatase